MNHYAGTVHYDVRGFSEKNKDELLLNVREVLQSSSLPLLKSIFTDPPPFDSSSGPASPAPAGKSGGGGAPAKGGSDKQTQSTQFRGQLDSLMKTLNSTEPHYIRCVKPNSVKKGNIFDAPICLQQLRYAGVFEAVKVRQQGFPFRWTHDAFFKRYRCAASNAKLRGNIPVGQSFPYKDKCREVLEDIAAMAPKELAPVNQLFKFGKTMVLYRADQHRVLEMIRDHVRAASALTCQRVYRGHVRRKWFKVLKLARDRMRAAIVSRLLAQVQASMAEAKTLPFRMLEVRTLEALEQRLLEEKACIDALTTLYPLDPAENLQAYESALKDAKRLEISAVAHPIITQCQAKFATVKDRIETKANLAKGIAIGDKDLILRSLARADELKKDWGDIVPASQLEAAQSMLVVIKLEETVQEDLKAALLTGGPSGEIGALDASTIDVTRLELAVADATSGKVSIKTAYGANLIATCSKLRDLRLALRGGVWEKIEAAVAAMVQMRKDDKLVDAAEPEVRRAEAEVSDRRVQNELLNVLSSGAPKGRVGELDVKSADVAGLAAAIQRTRDLAAHTGGLSPTATQLLASADLLLRLRQAMVATDWAGIKKAVHEGTEMKLAEPCLNELMIAKAELDNHAIVHQLTDALEKGAASGTVSRLDLSTIDTTVLIERIEHAEEIGPRTQQAHALLKLARIVKRVREAMRDRKFAELLDIVSEANSVPREFVPAGAAHELAIAKYEGQNVLLVKALSDAICKGSVNGDVGNIDRQGVDVRPLQEALKLAASLKCRSPHAVWLQEVAESLVEMRLGFKTGSWDGLAELLYAVKGMHGSRPNEKVDLSSLSAALPPLTRTSVSSRDPSSSMLPGNRSRGSSQDKRPSFLRPSDPNSTPLMQRTGTIRRGSLLMQPGGGHIAGAAAAAAAAAHAKNEAHSPGHDDVFFLPREVQEELVLVQDEMNNHTTITELATRLSSGGPGGELGLLNASHVELDQLSIALKRAQRNGIKTPLAAALSYTGQVVRDLRQSLRDNDWVSVEATLRYVAINNARVARSLGVHVPPAPVSYLSSAPAKAPEAPTLPTSATPAIDVPSYSADPTVMEQASITLVMPGLAEVVRVEAEALYRRVLDQMTAALQAGAATGAVGKIDTRPCDVSQLALAIDAARALGSRTKQSRHLTALCRLMWQMRTAVVDDDWASVESLLVAGAAVLGLAEGQSPDEKAAVPAAVNTETELYRAEAYNRRIIETLRAALTTRQATGEIGRLNLSDVDSKPLEVAIKLALQLGPKTPEAKCLLSTAVHLRALRLALLGGNWDRLGELLDYYFHAEHKTKPYTRYGGAAPAQPSQQQQGAYGSVLSTAPVTVPTGGASSALSSPTAESSPSAVSVSAAPSASARPYATTNTKEGIGAMAVWPGVVEAGDGYDIAVDGVGTESAQEANIMQLELNNRNIIVELTKACSNGSAQGGVGHLDVSTIKTGDLDWAIDYASRIGCMTVEAEQMLLTAQVLRRIRLALGHGNWSALEEALASARGRVLADVGAVEIQSAQDELDNRVILSELASALAKGRPQGRVGRVYTGSIDLRPVNDAIALSQRLGPKTQEAKQMLFTAKVVARLRMCLVNEDMPEAGLTLEAIRGKLLASVAMPEIRSIQDEVDNWTVIKELTTAITTGCASGTIGRIDLADIDTSSLEASLNHADELGVKTTEASNLYTAAAQAYKLRTALVKDNWSGDDGEGVESVLKECDDLPMSDLVHPELDLLRGELNNRRIVLSLASALSKGCAKGPVGEMDTSDVDVSDLDLAIAQASELGTRTQEADRLLSAAKMVRRLRSVLLAGNWQWVGSVLLEARQLKHIFPPVSLKELQAAQDELDNKAIIAQINAALRQGVPVGSIGHIDPTSVDVSVLDESLGYARTLGVKSIEAGDAVAAAQVMRRLRVAVKANDWSEAREVIESQLKGKALPQSATDELQLIKLCVDNWSVIQDLTIGVSTGGPVGPLGDPDIKAIKTAELDAAVQATMTKGCHTVEARRCLVTALTVRRLRAALLDSDWSFLSQVLTEAERDVDSLLPQCAAEIQYARDTMEFRSTMEALNAATQSQDETALIEALQRAQKLRLADHPRTHVRSTIETATMALTRIQRCKSSLAGGIRSMDAAGLLDALSMAAGMGYTHALVDEAKRVLSRVQEMTDRANVALRTMDAIGMSTASRDCEAIGLKLPVLSDMKRVLAMPRGEFLRRELDAVLTSIATGSGIVGGGADALALATLTSPSKGGDAGASSSSAHPRAPTPLELRVVNCTVQIKDLFFADQPDSDEVIAAALTANGNSGSAITASSSSASPSSPTKQQLATLLASNPTAAAAIATLRIQRNTEENVRGAGIRLTPAVQAAQTSAPMFLFTHSTLNSGALFKPAGYARSALAAAAAASSSVNGGSSSSSSAIVGAAVPPSHSSLRRQLALDRFPRVKPPHMFSSRYPPSMSINESGLLRYQHEPLHTSLTLLQSSEARRAAVKCFRNILAFMGDRPLSKPIAQGQEVLSLCHAMPEIRDEVLMQLCKQLSGNPSIASAERGWVLLYVCLCTFHPSDDFENHLELWLRDNGATPCVWALHLCQYRSGPGLAGVPSLSEIATALERARAPPLPSFVLDDESAGSVAEYASVGKLNAAVVPAVAAVSPRVASYSSTLESKTVEAKDDAIMTLLRDVSAPGGVGGMLTKAEWDRENDEEHAMQLAMLQAMASRAKTTASAAPPSAPVPFKTSTSASASYSTSGAGFKSAANLYAAAVAAARGGAGSPSMGGASYATPSPPPSSSSYAMAAGGDVISQVLNLGSPVQARAAGPAGMAVVRPPSVASANSTLNPRPITPTKPGTTASGDALIGFPASTSGGSAASAYMLAYKPTIGSTPATAALSAIADDMGGVQSIAAGTTSSSFQVTAVNGASKQPAGQQPASSVVDSDIESKIASISRALESF